MQFENAEFELAAATGAQLPASDALEFCFAGRSNVGKSSLLNRLFGRKALARVSTRPGKTVTINFYRAGGVRFVDLPGYGYAKISAAEKQRFAVLMDDYFKSERNIALVVQLIDLRHPPAQTDYEMLAFAERLRLPFCVALTKLDKLKPLERERRLAAVKEELRGLPPETRIIPVSAQTGQGVQTLKTVLEEYMINGGLSQ